MYPAIEPAPTLVRYLHIPRLCYRADLYMRLCPSCSGMLCQLLVVRTLSESLALAMPRYSVAAVIKHPFMRMQCKDLEERQPSRYRAPSEKELDHLDEGDLIKIAYIDREDVW